MEDTFAKNLKAQLKSLKQLSPYGTFHEALANTLNWWFNSKFLKKQTGFASGVIEVPSGAPIPFAAKVRPIATRFVFESNILKSLMTNEFAFERLFEHIGVKISSTLFQWTGFPKLDSIGNSLYSGIASTFILTFNTGHFRSVGMKYKKESALLDPLDANIFIAVWDLFESNLKNAINTIMPASNIVKGAAPYTVTGYTPSTEGLFTGRTTIKLITP